MAQQPTDSEVNRFVREVDSFMQNYATLIAPDTRALVYNSGNPKLIGDYESAVNKGATLKATIENTVGAWNAFKRGYEAVTSKTSMYIGDAIDEIRSWFGYNPGGMNGLGALQIPAAAWMAAIVAAAYLLNKTMKALFVSIEASRLQRENPQLSRGAALEKAREKWGGGFFDSLALPLIAGALVLGLIVSRR